LKKDKKTTKITNFSLLSIIVVIFFGIFVLLVVNRFLFRNKSFSKKMTVKKVLSVKITSPTPVFISTPTPIENPTPTPAYSGFCLRVPVLMYHHVMPQSQAVAHGQTS